MPAPRLTRRMAGRLLLAATAGRATVARAAPSFGDVTRFVFIPSAEQPVVSVLGVQSNQLVDTIPLGLVPAQMLISRTEAQLVATDGRSAGFVAIDLTKGGPNRVSLPHPAERLVLGSNGWLLAAADLAGGTVTLYDVRRRVTVARVSGLPRIHDLMFVAEDGVLFVAAAGWTDIAAFDANTGQALRRIGPVGTRQADILALSRTPNGRTALARPAGSEPPSLIDIEAGRVVGPLGTIAAPDGVVPSGTGAFLFVPDNAGGTLGVYRENHPVAAATLPAAGGMGAVYSAWLDSVAFVACAPRRQLLVYDLDHLAPAGSLDLPGIPGQGGVTPDSTRLYVPLTSPAGLAVIDGQTRRLVTAVSLPSPPLAAVVPGGWGLCH